MVLSTDALPCAINDEGLRQFRVKRYATWHPLAFLRKWVWLATLKGSQVL